MAVTIPARAAAELLDEDEDEEQQPQGSGGAGEEAANGGQPPALGPRGEEHDDGQEQEEGLGVAHGEHEGRGRQAEQPGGPTSSRSVELVAGEQVEAHGGQQAGQVGDQQQGGARGRSERGVGDAGELGVEGEEAQAAAARPGVAQLGDGAVPARVPAEEPLSGAADRSCGAEGQVAALVAGQAQGGADYQPAEQPGEPGHRGGLDQARPPAPGASAGPCVRTCRGHVEHPRRRALRPAWSTLPPAPRPARAAGGLLSL